MRLEAYKMQDFIGVINDVEVRNEAVYDSLHSIIWALEDSRMNWDTDFIHELKMALDTIQDDEKMSLMEAELAIFDELFYGSGQFPESLYAPSQYSNDRSHQRQFERLSKMFKTLQD